MDILRQAGRAVKGIGSTVTGGVEHAVIAIVDQRDEEVTEEDNTISSLPDLISKGTKGVTDKLKQFANEHAPVLSSMGLDIQYLKMAFLRSGDRRVGLESSSRGTPYD